MEHAKILFSLKRNEKLNLPRVTLEYTICGNDLNNLAVSAAYLYVDDLHGFVDKSISTQNNAISIDVDGTGMIIGIEMLSKDFCQENEIELINKTEDNYVIGECILVLRSFWSKIDAALLAISMVEAHRKYKNAYEIAQELQKALTP